MGVEVLVESAKENDWEGGEDEVVEQDESVCQSGGERGIRVEGGAGQSGSLTVNRRESRREVGDGTHTRKGKSLPIRCRCSTRRDSRSR